MQTTLRVLSLSEPIVVEAEGAVLKDDLSAIDQLNHWKLVKTNYCEHNPSVTISIGEEEWITAADWVYANWDIIGGLAFLARNDHVYQLAPYEEIPQERYDEMVNQLPTINFANIVAYEREDTTQGSKELACVGGVCEFIPEGAPVADAGVTTTETVEHVTV